MTPVRVQRKRTKGWKMPENTVYVGRPSKWGNAIDWRDYEEWYPGDFHSEWRRMAASDFGMFLKDRAARGEPRQDYPSNDQIRAELAGKNLACWCPLDQACHADVLLELASEP